MISGLSSTAYTPSAAAVSDQKQRPSTLPAQVPSQLPSGPEVAPPQPQPPDDLAKLRAARAVTEHPIAVAAVSDNSQVDKVATNVYISQQARELLNTYSTSTNNALGNDSSGGSSNSGVSPLAIAAVSDNANVDKLATTLYTSHQALQAVGSYQNIYSDATSQQSSTVDEKA